MNCQQQIQLSELLPETNTNVCVQNNQVVIDGVLLTLSWLWRICEVQQQVKLLSDQFK